MKKYEKPQAYLTLNASEVEWLRSHYPNQWIKFPCVLLFSRIVLAEEAWTGAGAVGAIAALNTALFSDEIMDFLTLGQIKAW